MARTSSIGPPTNITLKPKQRRTRLPGRKNVMSSIDRRLALEADPWSAEVQETKVRCRGCEKWIKLDQRYDYYEGLWAKHRDICRGVKAMKGEVVIERKRGRRPGKRKAASTKKPKVAISTSPSPSSSDTPLTHLCSFDADYPDFSLSTTPTMHSEPHVDKSRRRQGTVATPSASSSNTTSIFLGTPPLPSLNMRGPSAEPGSRFNASRDHANLHSYPVPSQHRIHGSDASVKPQSKDDTSPSLSCVSSSSSLKNGLEDSDTTEDHHASLLSQSLAGISSSTANRYPSSVTYGPAPPPRPSTSTTSSSCSEPNFYPVVLPPHAPDHNAAPSCATYQTSGYQYNGDPPLAQAPYGYHLAGYYAASPLTYLSTSAASASDTRPVEERDEGHGKLPEQPHEYYGSTPNKIHPAFEDVYRTDSSESENDSFQPFAPAFPTLTSSLPASTDHSSHEPRYRFSTLAELKSKWGSRNDGFVYPGCGGSDVDGNTFERKCLRGEGED